MKVFISIPMNGRSDQEVRNERDSIFKMVKAMDNDAELIDQMLPDTGSRIGMLGRSISMMKDADLVVFANGWSNSPGCRIEYNVCQEYEIKNSNYDVINMHYHMKINAYPCIVDDPNDRKYNNKLVGTFNSISDVDDFCKLFNHNNNYSNRSTKLSCGNRIKINDGTYNQEWMIAGFDCEYKRKAVDGRIYDNGYGIALIPVKQLDVNAWNYNGDTSTGYLNSDIHKYLNGTVSPALKTVLGNHLVNRNVLLSNGIDDDGRASSYQWTNAYATLMSVGQLTGQFGFNESKFDDGESNYQLPVFKYTPFKTGSNFWSRGIYDNYGAWDVYSGGSVDSSYASYSDGVRPLIYIR